MRLVVVAVCSLQLLFSGQTLLRSEAFAVPGISSRSHQQPRSSCLRAASDGRSSGGGGGSSSSSSSSSISTGGMSGNTATATGRAREIAAQARRRARDEGSRIRGAVQDPPVRGGGRATRGGETSSETGEGRTPSPPPRQQRRGRARLSQRGVNGSPEGRLNGRAQAEGSGAASPESATADATAAPTVIAAANVGSAAAAATAAASEQEVDALQRRVKEVLEEYCTKAPPEERWPQGRKIRVRGVEIFYKDTGSRSLGGTRSTRKDRPTFVLLHGLAGSTASWDEVVGDLSEYGRVISFDRPGFGRTERVMPPTPAGLPTWRLCAKTMGENPYSADFAAKALFGVLDRLGVDKVIVVAHSLGAQVALRAARARPGMVRALVLTAPAILNPLDSKFVMGRDPNANLFSAILNLRTRVEMTAKLAAFNLQLLQPGEAPLHAVRNMTLNGDLEERVQQNFHDRSITLGRPELVAKYIEPLRDPLWDRGLLHFYKSLQGEVQPGEQLLQSTLDVWSGPSMIITGDDDPTVPTQSSIYVAESMESRLVVIESCAHIPMDEKSEVFTSSVLSFANSEEVEEAWRADGDSVKSWW